MNTAIALRAQSRQIDTDQWNIYKEQARVFIASRLLPDSITTPEAALTVMVKGWELGLPPMQALNGITVIKGKPTMSAELMAAVIYRDHGDESLYWVENTNERAVLRYKRRTAKQSGEYTYTIEDAKRAGLLSNQTWSKYPSAMLRARCISAVARLAFPDSIGGMYLPEEMGTSVNEEGDVLTLPHIEATAPIVVTPPAIDAPTALDAPAVLDGEFEERTTPATPMAPTNVAPLSEEATKLHMRLLATDDEDTLGGILGAISNALDADSIAQDEADMLGHLADAVTALVGSDSLESLKEGWGEVNQSAKDSLISTSDRTALSFMKDRCKKRIEGEE